MESTPSNRIISSTGGVVMKWNSSFYQWNPVQGSMNNVLESCMVAVFIGGGVFDCSGAE